jgi:hypothetical protein
MATDTTMRSKMAHNPRETCGWRVFVWGAVLMEWWSGGVVK